CMSFARPVLSPWIGLDATCMYQQGDLARSEAAQEAVQGERRQAPALCREVQRRRAQRKG
ncbi:hypothetical protein B8W95_13440, partial [Staphylococcus pasteuri]